MSKRWSCDRWGSTTGPDRADPACRCSMCDARRADKERAKKTRKKKRR